MLQIARDLERFAPDEEPDRIVRHVHRGLGSMLASDLGFVWRLGRGSAPEATYHLAWTPKGEKLLQRSSAAGLREQALRFARDGKSPGDAHLLFTTVQTAGRPFAVMAFLRPGRRFGRRDAHLGADAADLTARHLLHRERERAFEVRERIVRKVLQELRPADILYQALHGLKRLLRFDHSASVHTYDPETSTLTLRAETIAWTKGKSGRIGRPLVLDAAAAAFAEGLDRAALWDPGHPGAAAPAAFVADLSTVAPDAPSAQSVIVAPLRHADRLAGLLTLRAITPGAFAEADRATIDSFLQVLSATAMHAEFVRRQEGRLYEAERRTALGNLARAISHDLNNAFGVIQPLLETLRRDVERRTITPEHLERDLETLSQYVGTSLRIFQGLLSFARGSTEGIEAVDVHASIDAVLNLFERSLRGQGIAVVREVPADLPRILARRQDLEQLFLNLLTNARESMPNGGRLTIRAWVEQGRDGATLRISIADTGPGIPAELLPRVFEPFYTTKSGGTGLGLDICRSIVWEYDGELTLESEVGKGTTAQIRLPLHPRDDSAPEERP